MKATRKQRNIWKKEYFSLSRLLRDTQTKSALTITAEIFAELGLPTSGKIKPAEVLNGLNPAQFVDDKKGNKFPAYVTQVAILDAEGKPVLDAEGNKTYNYKLTAIREGGWTLDKLCKLISDKNYYNK